MLFWTYFTGTLFLVLLIYFIATASFGKRSESFHGHNGPSVAVRTEDALSPPPYHTDDQDGYIEPLVWERPIIMNKEVPPVEFTRNF